MNTYSIVLQQLSNMGHFPYAVGLGPLEDNSYIQRMPPSLREQKEKSLAVNNAKPGLHIDGGSVWSDLIGYGGAYPKFFVSERIIGTFKLEKIPLYNIVIAPIADISKRSKKLISTPAPKYYLVEAHHGINKSWQNMGYKLNADGSPDMSTRPNPLWPLCLEGKTWKGYDVFCLNDPLWTTSLYCTDRIVELAEKHQWTNIAFEPVRVV